MRLVIPLTIDSSDIPQNGKFRTTANNGFVVIHKSLLPRWEKYLLICTTRLMFKGLHRCLLQPGTIDEEPCRQVQELPDDSVYSQIG